MHHETAHTGPQIRRPRTGLQIIWLELDHWIALFCLDSGLDNGAARVTAVVPYLCYSRKDRRTKSRDPVTTRYIAQLFEAVTIDIMVTVDVHKRE